MGARAAVAVAALVLAAVGVGPVSSRSGAQAGKPLASVQAVLDERVAALRSGDRHGWLATVDPRAPAALREAQARLFDGLRSVPLATYSLRARVEDTGDLSAGLSERYGGARVFLPETRQVLRFEGYDERDAVDSLWLTFVERDGRWFVGGDDDLSALGLDTARGLWDFGPVRVHRTEHLLTLSHPEQAERAEALAAIAEDAIGALAPRWDQPWPGRIPMILPGSVEELEKLLQSTIDLDKFVAFVSYGAVRDEGWEATAPRIYIQDRNLSSYGRAAQVETLVHELAHAAGAYAAGPFVPAWVHEGVADWIATGRNVRERKPSGGDASLPRDFEFITGSQTSILRSYRESRSAISYLAARAGVRAPTALFARLGQQAVAPGSVDHHVDAALRATAGFGLAELESGWSRR